MIQIYQSRAYLVNDFGYFEAATLIPEEIHGSDRLNNLKFPWLKRKTVLGFTNCSMTRTYVNTSSFLKAWVLTRITILSAHEMYLHQLQEKVYPPTNPLTHPTIYIGERPQSRYYQLEFHMVIPGGCCPHYCHFVIMLTLLNANHDKVWLTWRKNGVKCSLSMVLQSIKHLIDHHRTSNVKLVKINGVEDPVDWK